MTVWNIEAGTANPFTFYRQRPNVGGGGSGGQEKVNNISYLLLAFSSWEDGHPLGRRLELQQKDKHAYRSIGQLTP